MAGKRFYTDDEKAAGLLALTTHDGNTRRASRDTGIPEATLRNWKRNWDNQGGPPAAVSEPAAEKASDFVAQATTVRDEALAMIRHKLPEAKVGELNAVVGTLDDKITRAAALARGGKDDAPKQIDARAAGELLAGFVGEAMRQAQERSVVVQDTVTNNPQRELGTGD